MGRSAVTAVSAIAPIPAVDQLLLRVGAHDAGDLLQGQCHRIFEVIFVKPFTLTRTFVMESLYYVEPLPKKEIFKLSSRRNVAKTSKSNFAKHWREKKIL